MPAAEEPCPGEQGHHGLGEQEHDQDVDQGGQAEGVGESLHVADREVVQQGRREERHRVGHQDGAPGALPAALHGRAQRLAVADLVAEPFEVHDERVRRDADRHDEAGDGRQRHREVLVLAEQHHRQVGEERREQQAGDRHQRRGPGSRRTGRPPRGPAR